MPLDPKQVFIKQASVATLEQAQKFASRAKGGQEYVNEVFNLYAATGYSPEVVISQWAVETGVGTSPAWINTFNPAGIGITDGGDLGYHWKTAADGARGQSVHLSAYVDGYSYGLRKHLDLDPRYLLVLKTDWATRVRTVADLTGKWATDPQYGVKICQRIEELRAIQVTDRPPDPTTGLTFGKVPRPAIVDRTIPDANNTAWDDLGQRLLRGVVYHRQLGSNWGTDSWFRMMWQPNGEKGGGQLGLTDYGISRTSGEILKWNDPYGKGKAGVSRNRSGWASGPWSNVAGDGMAFVQKFGVNAINRDLASLEIDGNYDDPLQQAGFDAIVSLSAHLADSQRIPWNTYPINPATGLTFVYWHNEYTNKKTCPGKVIMDLTPQIIEATKQRMKKYQEG